MTINPKTYAAQVPHDTIGINAYQRQWDAAIDEAKAQELADFIATNRADERMTAHIATLGRMINQGEHAKGMHPATMERALIIAGVLS